MPTVTEDNYHEYPTYSVSTANGAKSRVGGGVGHHHSAEKRVLFLPGDSHQQDKTSQQVRSGQWGNSSTPASATSCQNKGGGSNHSKPNENASNNRMARGESLASDWVDEPSNPHPPQPVASRYNFKVGIYGWRKRFLYLLILGLMVMVIVNLALTLWVLKVMEFSSEGMGELRIVAGGIQLSGQAMVLDALLASTIRSRKGQHISIESSRNFTVNARDEGGRVVNRIFLGNDQLECLAREFKVTDARGTVLFSASKHEVVVGAKVLRVTGEGGAIFDGTVQTPIVRADSGHELRLESPTRSLKVRAPLGVLIESRAGDISASCLTDLKLQSLAGAVRLDSANVFLPGLKTAPPPLPGAPPPAVPRRPNSPRHEIFQLCVCSNGKLFLASPEGVCAADDDSVVCR